MPGDTLLDRHESRRRLGCSNSKFYDLIASKVLPVVHLGRAVRVPASALDAFIAAGGVQNPSGNGTRAACPGTTQRGKPCRNPPITGSALCGWHDPAVAAERAAERKQKKAKTEKAKAEEAKAGKPHAAR